MYSMAASLMFGSELHLKSSLLLLGFCNCLDMKVYSGAIVCLLYASMLNPSMLCIFPVVVIFVNQGNKASRQVFTSSIVLFLAVAIFAVLFEVSWEEDISLVVNQICSIYNFFPRIYLELSECIVKSTNGSFIEACEYSFDAVTSLCVRLVLLLTEFLSSENSVENNHIYGTDNGGFYNPSLGVRWYLEAQMLHGFRLYFQCLFAIQPVICSYIMSIFIAPDHAVESVSHARCFLVRSLSWHFC
jgi:hypothetical protein